MESSAANGSSRSKTGASVSIVRTKATRWRMPAGELGRVGICESVQLEGAQAIERAGSRFAAGNAVRFERNRGVGLDRAPRHEQVPLAHIGALAEAVSGVKLPPVEQHRTGIRLDQPGDNVEQRALARSGRADHRHELARSHGEGDVVQHRQAGSPLDIGRGEIADVNCRDGIAHAGSVWDGG